jgi:hypothetical protein
MLLTYSNDRFPPLIKKGIKIHTIRLDQNDRWKPGMQIHHWMHNPRNVKMNPYHFNAPDCEILISKQPIEIQPDIDMIRVTDSYGGVRFLSDIERELLAKNDGFTSLRQFYTWFNEPFKGYILHWTNLIY